MVKFVYLVFYQQEPHSGSIFSGCHDHEGAENVNAEFIGAYRTVSAANEAALDYWMNTLGMDKEDGMSDEDGYEYNYDDDHILDLFWDAEISGADVFTLSERVYVEKEKVN